VRTEKASLTLSPNAVTVLERRYLARDESGKLTETPEGLFRRVAKNIAQAERGYAPSGQAEEAAAAWEECFFSLMTSLRFLPNSPTLGNAGRPLQQLSACFVLPVEDSIAGIFETVKETALIHQSGGGTGFSFSRLRPAGDVVQSTGGVASGPVSFMKVFDGATEAIKQGGTRRGANMAILDVRHPDIEAFIDAKTDMVTLTNFNISVAVDAAYMEAVEGDREYELINPRTGHVVRSIGARKIFERIVANAWANGDPGLVFLDRINRDNPTPALGRIEGTNPCGEQPLLPYESCNLGSINLSLFSRAHRGNDEGQAGRTDAAAGIDWDGLAETVRMAVRFLDDVIDMNAYPIPEIERMTKLTRKIGLGVMGLADLLFDLGIPYDSEEALGLAERLMGFIREHADNASEALAGDRGVFPAWEQSVYGPAGSDRRIRNSTRTTVAPTGTLSIIAGCSGGIEPAFAVAFTRQHFLDPSRPSEAVRMAELNPVFERVARAGGWWSEELATYLALGGSLGERDEVPDRMKDVFVTAHEIEPVWHVRMQAAFQRHTDNAVSKTINFPRQATVGEVAEAYMLAYREGCKGITIYRDGSRVGQVLSHVAEGEGLAIGEEKGTYDANGVQAEAEALSLSAPTGSRPRRRRGAAGATRSRNRYTPPRPALPFSEIDTTHGCPDCGSALVFSEGCLTCRACGFTRCG
jgi:ribonucleoside-diphosphate reductase alpha chain